MADAPRHPLFVAAEAQRDRHQERGDEPLCGWCLQPWPCADRETAEAWLKIEASCYRRREGLLDGATRNWLMVPYPEDTP